MAVSRHLDARYGITSTLTEDGGEVFHTVGQVNGQLGDADMFEVLADDGNVATQLVNIMLDDLFRAEHRQDAAFGDGLAIGPRTAALQYFSPDVSDVPVPARRPSRSGSIFHIQARLERIAVRHFGRAIDGRLALVAHRTGRGLSSQQEWMRVGLIGDENGVDEKSDDDEREERGDDGPFGEDTGNTRIE
jgi:hypothetical protein